MTTSLSSVNAMLLSDNETKDFFSHQVISEALGHWAASRFEIKSEEVAASVSGDNCVVRDLCMGQLREGDCRNRRVRVTFTFRGFLKKEATFDICNYKGCSSYYVTGLPRRDEFETAVLAGALESAKWD